MVSYAHVDISQLNVSAYAAGGDGGAGTAGDSGSINGAAGGAGGTANGGIANIGLFSGPSLAHNEGK